MSYRRPSRTASATASAAIDAMSDTTTNKSAIKTPGSRDRRSASSSEDGVKHKKRQREDETSEEETDSSEEDSTKAHTRSRRTTEASRKNRGPSGTEGKGSSSSAKGQKQRKKAQTTSTDSSAEDINPHLYYVLRKMGEEVYDEGDEVVLEKAATSSRAQGTREEHEEEDEDSGTRTFIVFDPDSGFPLNVWTTKTSTGAVKRHFNSIVAFDRQRKKSPHAGREEPSQTQSNDEVPAEVRKSFEKTVQEALSNGSGADDFMRTYYSSNPEVEVGHQRTIYILEWGAPSTSAMVYHAHRGRVTPSKSQENPKRVRVKTTVVRDLNEHMQNRAIQGAKLLETAHELAEEYRREKGYELAATAKFRSQRKTRQLRLIDVLNRACLDVEQEE
eukprot:gb/GECG01006655.1/.p1 GENE.gb/GECG01006655.1/~~gb/GECG01006655.1/.p1  ORF type:complete len:388 (+),score=72.79 gb/GECG01006655.1/:1-1164(+)